MPPFSALDLHNIETIVTSSSKHSQHEVSHIGLFSIHQNIINSRLPTFTQGENAIIIYQILFQMNAFCKVTINKSHFISASQITTHAKHSNQVPQMTSLLGCIFTTSAAVLLNLYALQISFNTMHLKK